MKFPTPSSPSLAAVGRLASLVLAAFAACSSSNDTSAPYSLLNCPAGEPFSPASECTTCIQSSCASYLSTANSACASYVTCACPGTVDASTCSDGPGETLLEDGGVSFNACGDAVGGIKECVASFCAIQCGEGDGG